MSIIDLPTSASIAAQLGAARDRLAQLAAEIGELSYPAVAGDARAAADLATARAETTQVEADCSVLETALKVALQREADAAHRDMAEQRAEAMAAARKGAAELIELAGQIDELCASLKRVVGQIDNAERAIWRDLGEAGEKPASGVVGLKGLGQMSLDRLKLAMDGRLLYLSDQRSIAEVARSAWSNLLTDEGDQHV